MEHQWEQIPTRDHVSGAGKTVSLQQREIVGKLNLVSFCCASSVTIAGVFGTFWHKRFEAFEIMTSIYLALFGVIIIILDVPLNFTRLIRLKEIIRKYCRLLTRLTGKGVWFIFLGCTSFATLWDTRIACILAWVISLPVCIFGISCLVFGILKSQQLDKLRQELRVMKDQGNLEDTVRQYASVGHGLSSVDFAKMAGDICQIQFSPEDLTLSFDALICESDPLDRQDRDILTYDCILDWVSDGFLLLL
eukprot:GEMP01019675.1.p1 GENE.GEMP01019675.1~~GEMP01019675.1.p1  ORF type:complete len:269 (+),score=16.89 GEMP01019675.1:62-808(+)